MVDTESAGGVRHVDSDNKSDDRAIDKDRGNGFGHLLTEEEELFLSSVEPAEQDKIFRKVCVASLTKSVAEINLWPGPASRSTSTSSPCSHCSTLPATSTVQISASHAENPEDSSQTCTDTRQ